MNSTAARFTDPFRRLPSSVRRGGGPAQTRRRGRQGGLRGETIGARVGVLCDVQKLTDGELVVLDGGLGLTRDALVSPLGASMSEACDIGTVPRLRISSLLGAGIAALDMVDDERT